MMPLADTSVQGAAKDTWRNQLEETVRVCRQGLVTAEERHAELHCQLLAQEKFLAGMQERLVLAEQMLQNSNYCESPAQKGFSKPESINGELAGFSFGFSPQPARPVVTRGPHSPNDELSKFSFNESHKKNQAADSKRHVPLTLPPTPTRPPRQEHGKDAASDVDMLSIQEAASANTLNLKPVTPLSTMPAPEKTLRSVPARAPASLTRSRTMSHVSNVSTASSHSRTHNGGFDVAGSRFPSSQSSYDLKAPITRTMSITSEMSQLSASHPILDRLTDVIISVEIGLLGKLPKQLRARGEPAVVLRLTESENSWLVCKSYPQLKKLETLVRPFCASMDLTLPPFPDKDLFTNQTPENVDQRNDMLQAFIGQIKQIGDAKKRTGMALTMQSKQMVGQFFLSDAVELSPVPLVKGYLLRRARFGSWKVRYYVVNGSFLDVYDKIEGPAVDTIKLRGASVHFVEPPLIGTTDERCAFEIIDSHKKRTLFCSDNLENREKWVTALSAVASGPLIRQSVLTMPVPFTLLKTPLVLRSPSPAAEQPMERSLSHELRRPSHGDSFTTESDDTDSYSLISSTSMPRLGSFRQHPDLKTQVQSLGNLWRASGGSYDPSKPRRVFGATLAATMKVASRNYEGVELPAVFVRCLEILNSDEALSEEGLFRVSGSQSTLDRIESTFEEIGDFDLKESGCDVHVVATLLKRYLRSLPESFLPGVDEPTLRAILDLDPAARSAQLAKIVHSLPKLQYQVLLSVAALLVSVANFQQLNKMSSRNISIVFAPSLNVPSGVALAWIEDFENIFETPQ